MAFILQAKKEHIKILNIFSEIEAIGLSDIDKVFKLLTTSSEYIIDHLEKENDILYPTLNASKDTETLYITSQFEFEMKSIAIDVMGFFDDYHSTNDIKCKSDAYLEDLSKIVNSLKIRIAKEEETLYTLFPKDK
jgi:hemerythrin-like domain-containing protein